MDFYPLLGEEKWDDARKTLESLANGNLNDYEMAIEEGANVVRIGRALLGPGE